MKHLQPTSITLRVLCYAGMVVASMLTYTLSRWAVMSMFGKWWEWGADFNAGAMFCIMVAVGILFASVWVPLKLAPSLRLGGIIVAVLFGAMWGYDMWWLAHVIVNGHWHLTIFQLLCAAVAVGYAVVISWNNEVPRTEF